MAMVVKAIANLLSPTWYYLTEVERESVEDEVWATSTRGKKKKAVKKLPYGPCWTEIMVDWMTGARDIPASCEPSSAKSRVVM